MKSPVLGKAALCLLLLAIRTSPTLKAQVTAKQGAQDPTEFSGSMVLDAPFPPAVPGTKKNEWFTTADYGRMRLYHCDRISIVLFQFKVGAERSGKVPVSLRVWLSNPEGNHDKSVELLLEAHNGEQKVAEARRSIKVEENDVVKREIELPVSAADLKSDPVTQLRITVRPKNI